MKKAKSKLSRRRQRTASPSQLETGRDNVLCEQFGFEHTLYSPAKPVRLCRPGITNTLAIPHAWLAGILTIFTYTAQSF